jgi:hypothetical protein
MRVLIEALALGFSTSTCLAEDCMSMPPGPDKRACAMRNHPVAFEARIERCQHQVDLAKPGKENAGNSFNVVCKAASIDAGRLDGTAML